MVKEKIHNPVVTIITQFIGCALTSWWCNALCIFCIQGIILRYRPSSTISLALVLYIISRDSLGLNPGLSNTLSWIHPVLLCFVYSKFFEGMRVSFFKKTLFIYYTWCCLFLGGWWAFQEFTWGGWWNWDSVEFPIFSWSIYLLIVLLHSYTRTYKTFHVLWVGGTILVINIFAIRFLTNSSVHSFIDNTVEHKNYFFNVTYSISWLVQLLAQILSIPSFIFIKGFICLITLILMKLQFKIRNKTILHHLVVPIVICIQSFNIKYAEVMYTKNVQHLLIHYGHEFWIKPSSVKLNSVLMHLNMLIN